MVNREHLSMIVTNQSNNLADLSDHSPVLLVFLRHFGCVFCKDSMDEISKKRLSLENRGIKIVMVHMADNQIADIYFNNFGLKGIEHVSDPDCKYYSVFGLVKGSFGQLFGLKTWMRGFEIATTKQMLPSTKRIGDGLQMPGIFLLKSGEVIQSFIHNSVADRPNYETFVEICAV